ncbi:MAG TPA: ABC transporter substrate-binding protein [Verrucomicrobiae bacterium]|jgi:branched-chain amino acid transport system substrate-binding protein|nr:ABC transporter substrate-binding protein [Verrucomicrobiae bacterium]
MRGIRIFVPVLVAIIVVGGLALQRAEPQAPKEVLIGVLLPLTGNFASLGQQYLWANQTVEDIVNNDYADLAVPLGPGKGFSGLGGATMKLVVRDDQSRGDLARSLVEQLITVNKVHWVDGEGTSGNTSIIQPVVEGYGIPLSCHACASPTLTDKGFKWFWRTGPHDRLMVDSVFRFLQEWPKNGGPTDLKTVAVFTCDNLFCQDNHKIALEHAAKAGFKVVADLTTKTGATTLASEVQRLQSANPDILFFVQYPAESAVFQADAKRAGWMPKVIATSNGCYSDQTWLEAQKKTNGGAAWLGRDPTAIDLASKKPSWKKVNEIYKKYSRGQDMGELAMRQITGMLWVADTINRAKSVEPAVLAKAAADTNTTPDQMIIDYKGIRFDKNNQNELASGVVTQIGWDGEKHTIWPWDLAKQAGYTPVYPSPNWQERDAKPKPAK